MKKLSIAAVVVAIILAVVLGVQVNQKNKLDAEVKELRAASADFEETTKELETVKASLEEAQTQMETLTTEKAAQDTKLEEAQKGMEEALAQVETLTDEKTGLLATLDTGKLNLETLTKEKEALTQQVADLNKAGEEAATKLSAAQKEAEGLKASLTAAEEKVAEVEKLRDALAAEKEALTEKVKGLEQQVKELESSGEGVATNLADALKSAEDWKVQAEADAQKLAELETQYNDQVAKVAEAAELRDALAAEKEALTEKVTALEQQVAELTKAEEAVATKLAAAQKEAEALKASVTAEEAKVAEAVELRDALTAEKEALTDKVAELETQYQEQVAKAEALEKAAVEAEAKHQEALAAAVAAAQAGKGESRQVADPQEDPEAALQPVAVQIFHTNDVHSRVEGNDKDLIGYAKLATLVKQAREQGPTLLLDVGDVLHGMSFSTALQGESMVKMMNLLGYDAMAPGNHDFNYGYDRLQELQKMMNFPVLNANIVTAEDAKFAFEPYVIKEVGGKRIALVGAANPQIQSAIHPDRIKGLSFEGIDFVEQAVEGALEEKPDAVIILAHWGADGAYDPNSSVLAQITGVDLVIDGHSHTRYEDIQQVEGGALIVSAHEYLKTIGHLTMQFDEQNQVTIDVSQITYEDAAQVEPDEAVANAIEAIKQEIDAVTGEVVGKTKVYLEGAREMVRTQETNLGDLAADALRLSAQADFAVTNGGGIRTSVEAGDITKGNLIEVFPFGNSVVLIEVRGAQLLEAMEHGLRLYPEQNGGFPQISGGKLVFDPAQEAGKRVVSLEVDGKPVDPNGTYLVATNDFMAAGGDDYVMFKESPVLLYGGTLDEALIEHIQSLGEVEQEVDGRIQVLEAVEEVPVETEDVEATEKPAA